MHVLITGGAGFIGSHTADALLARGIEVTILDSLEKPVHQKGKPSYLSPKFRFFEGDVRSRDLMLKALNGVDAVIHLAAYQDYLPDFSKFFSVNSVGTALLYELIVEKKLPIRKIVVASSQAVAGEGLYRNSSGDVFAPQIRTLADLESGRWDFSDPATGESLTCIPTPETHANPQNQYALSKHSQETMAIAFGKRYDIPTAVARYSIVQGARQSFYNSYSGACRIFSLSYFFGKAPTIYEDGRQVRDFVNIADAVDANLILLIDDRAAGSVYNVGGGEPVTVAEFCTVVATEYGHDRLKPAIPGWFRFGDTRHSVSDISNLRALGWKPSKSIQESVAEYHAYLEAQTDVEDILEFASKNMRALNVVREAKVEKSA